MFLDKKKLLAVFLIALVLTLFVPVIFPSLRLLYLAPVVIVAIYQRSVIGACWVALGCGLILDLLYAQDRFGPYTTSFVIATVLIYSQKRHFFADNLITLPIMTFLFSVAASFVQFIYVAAMERSVHLSVAWIFTDLLILPVLDSLVGFVLFIVPSFLLGYKPRKGEEYFAE